MSMVICEIKDLMDNNEGLCLKNSVTGNLYPFWSKSMLLELLTTLGREEEYHNIISECEDCGIDICIGD